MSALEKGLVEYAIMNDLSKEALDLIERGAPITDGCDICNLSTLGYAIAHGMSDVVCALLNRGVDVMGVAARDFCYEPKCSRDTEEKIEKIEKIERTERAWRKRTTVDPDQTTWNALELALCLGHVDILIEMVTHEKVSIPGSVLSTLYHNWSNEYLKNRDMILLLQCCMDVQAREERDEALISNGVLPSEGRTYTEVLRDSENLRILKKWRRLYY